MSPLPLSEFPVIFVIFLTCIVRSEVSAGDIDPRSTLVFANCNECTFVIDSLCTKVFVQSCNDFSVTFNAKVGL